MLSIIRLLMYRDPVHQARDAAAEGTLEEMRRDRDRMPPRLRPLLSYLLGHLFDPELNATRAWRKAGIRDVTEAVRIGLSGREVLRPPTEARG